MKLSENNCMKHDTQIHNYLQSKINQFVLFITISSK